MSQLIPPPDADPLPEPVFGGFTETPSLPLCGARVLVAIAVFVAASVAGGFVGSAVDVGEGVCVFSLSGVSDGSGVEVDRAGVDVAGAVVGGMLVGDVVDRPANAVPVPFEAKLCPNSSSIPTTTAATPETTSRLLKTNLPPQRFNGTAPAARATTISLCLSSAHTGGERTPAEDDRGRAKHQQPHRRATRSAAAGSRVRRLHRNTLIAVLRRASVRRRDGRRHWRRGLGSRRRRGCRRVRLQSPHRWRRGALFPLRCDRQVWPGGSDAIFLNRWRRYWHEWRRAARHLVSRVHDARCRIAHADHQRASRHGRRPAQHPLIQSQDNSSLNVVALPTLQLVRS